MSPVPKLVVVLGSCSVDFTSYAERLPLPGETLHGYKFTTSHGGKGANQCVAVAKFGGKVAMVAKVGDDHWGKDYIKRLSELGVDTTNVRCESNVTTGIAQINVSKSGENHIVIVPGANNKLSCDDVVKSCGVLEKAAVLVCQLETPLETTLEAFRKFSCIKILNAAPGIANLNKELLSLTTVLCVNESEAEIIVGKSIEKEGYANILKELLITGCQTAILTVGSQGAVFATKNNSTIWHVLCDKVLPVDTTGAGDAFIGALAALLSYQDDTPLVQIVGAACKVASMSVTLEGTQTSYPTLDIRTFLTETYKTVDLK